MVCISYFFIFVDIEVGHDSVTVHILFFLLHSLNIGHSLQFNEGISRVWELASAFITSV